MGDEVLNLFYAHFFGMAFIVKEDVTLDPVDVGFFGAKRIVFDAQNVADLFKKFAGRFFHVDLPCLYAYNLLI